MHVEVEKAEKIFKNVNEYYHTLRLVFDLKCPGNARILCAA
jgi:hypothetical protein